MVRNPVADAHVVALFHCYGNSQADQRTDALAILFTQSFLGRRNPTVPLLIEVEVAIFPFR